MKTLTGIICSVLLFFAGYVSAEESSVSYEMIELPVKYVKVSQDGTGVVTGFRCKSCGYKVLKITENSKAYANNRLTDIRQVETKKNIMVLVRFERKNGKVLDLRWSK